MNYAVVPASPCRLKSTTTTWKRITTPALPRIPRERHRHKEKHPMKTAPYTLPPDPGPKRPHIPQTTPGHTLPPGQPPPIKAVPTARPCR